MNPSAHDLPQATVCRECGKPLDGPSTMFCRACVIPPDDPDAWRDARDDAWMRETYSL